MKFFRSSSRHRFLCLYGLIVLFSGGGLAHAQAQKAAEDQNSRRTNSPYFQKVQRTVFVSGPFLQWIGKLQSAFPAVRNDAAVKQYWATPSAQIDTVVFVNAVSSNPERTGAAEFTNEKLKAFGVSTVVAGRCDFFCARIFVSGKTRSFAQDLPSEKTRLEFSVPFDLDSGLAERRFPNSQLAVLYKNIPALEKNEGLLIKGITSPSDVMHGGLFIYGDTPAQYCDSPNECTAINVDAFTMELTTQTKRIQVSLPLRMPAPVPTGFADINDSLALPYKTEKMMAAYQDYLKAPGPKAFAIGETTGQFSYRFGGADPVVKSLEECESFQNSRCRLYALGTDVVW